MSHCQPVPLRAQSRDVRAASRAAYDARYRAAMSCSPDSQPAAGTPLEAFTAKEVASARQMKRRAQLAAAHACSAIALTLDGAL